jgi:excisionase family DNA binding protein
MVIDSREVLMETHREMYFSTGEAARVLQISTSTVKRWERTGQLPSLKNHNGWRFFNAGAVFDLLGKLGAGE